MNTKVLLLAAAGSVQAGAGWNPLADVETPRVECHFAHNFMQIVTDKIFHKQTPKHKWGWWSKPENNEVHDSPFYNSPDDILAENSKGVPTAVFHGLGDACIYPGMGSIDRLIEKKTGNYVHCIEVGLPTLGEYINNFEHVAEVSCKKLRENKHFQGEFNVMGLSQGGLLARYITEECDMPGKVRNIVTMGGPHMGVDKIPQCFNGFVCDVVNFVAKRFVYFDVVQNWIAPAGYFRDVNNIKKYEKKSVFLPAMNNELAANDFANGQLTQHSELRKSRFMNVNSALFVMFTQDTMIYPKETAWFQQVDKKGHLMPLNESDFYKNDNIGLKTLNEAGKITFSSIVGNHLQFTEEDIENIIIPALEK